jgi:hypothetical protein
MRYYISSKGFRIFEQKETRRQRQRQLIDAYVIKKLQYMKAGPYQYTSSQISPNQPFLHTNNLETSLNANSPPYT